MTSSNLKNLDSKNLMILALLASLAVLLFVVYNQRVISFYNKSVAKMNQQQVQQPVKVMPKEATIALNAENNSGESGWVTLKEESGKVTVKVGLSGTPKGVAQPAHIHVGACPGVGAVKYPLSSVINGASTTTLNVTMADLLSQLPLAINVHKSASQAGVYVSCGQITSPAY